MFRPPVDRAMRVLDRSFFQKKIQLAAARILENNQISKCRSVLGHDVLRLERINAVQPDPEEASLKNGRKALLLAPSIRPDDPSTWTSRIQQLVADKKVDITPYELTLNYDSWTYLDIMCSILPEDDQGEIPVGFTVVGHVAHLNLREQYLPYKTFIANVIIDKNPAIRTVINKIDEVGTQSEYRTFQYELLAGDPSLEVEIKEQDCLFRFDYSTVYWNSRLGTEHERLVNMFHSGEAICDVMAGVGPFAVPAGKRKSFIWANDLNPASYAAMVDAIQRNHVSKFVRPFNEDGRAFIRNSAQQLLTETVEIPILSNQNQKSRSSRSKQPPPTVVSYINQPKTFNHYVMNLPATATTFLDAFIGLYRGHESLFAPHTSTKLPMIHIHCFSTKSDDNVAEKIKICQEISERIQHTITPEDEELVIWDVRDVAPQKRMFCASFRLPAEVAFR